MSRFFDDDEDVRDSGVACNHADTDLPRPRPVPTSRNGGTSNAAYLNDYRNRAPFHYIEEGTDGYYFWQYGAQMEIEFEISDEIANTEPVPPYVTSVRVGMVSVVDPETMIAYLGTMAAEAKEDYYTAKAVDEINAELVAKADTALDTITTALTAAADLKEVVNEALLVLDDRVAQAFVDATNTNLQPIRQDILAVERIAKGQRIALVFTTHAQLLSWIQGDFERSDGYLVENLLIGQHLYIKANDEDSFYVSELPVTGLDELAVLPDDPVSFDDYVDKDSEQLVTAIKTFAVLPQSEATPADDKDLVTKKFLLTDNVVEGDNKFISSAERDFLRDLIYLSPGVSLQVTGNNSVARVGSSFSIASVQVKVSNLANVASAAELTYTWQDILRTVEVQKSDLTENTWHTVVLPVALEGSYVLGPNQLVEFTASITDTRDIAVSGSLVYACSGQYDLYAGASSLELLTATDVAALPSVLHSIGDVTVSIETAEADYIWICVPMDRVVDKISQGGVRLSIDDDEFNAGIVVADVDSGSSVANYRCYRSSNPQCATALVLDMTVA